MSNEVDIALLRTLLTYEPETGRLFWLPRDVSLFKEGAGRYTAARSCAIWNKRYAGAEAFTAIGSHGYRVGAIFGRLLLAHRVAWAISVGEWPPEKIDHIDGDRGNNRFANFRTCSQAENLLNRPGNQTGRKTSKYKGVYWSRNARKWVARFRDRHIGVFDDEEVAARAYDAKSRAFNKDFSFQNFAVGN